MKKIISCIFIFCIVCLTCNVATAKSETSFTNAVFRANNEIKKSFGFDTYYEINKVNRKVYEEYKVLVYGEPHGNKKNGEYRYLGYTPTGEDFPNNDYPYDVSSSRDFDDLNWIKDPWNNSKVKTSYPNVHKNVFDYDREDYKEHFIKGMELYHTKRFRNDPSVDWEKYYHIVVPPTEHAHGIAWLWHTTSTGKLYYIDVALAPTEYIEKTIKRPLEPIGGGFYSNSYGSDVRYDDDGTLYQEWTYHHMKRKGEKVTFKIYEFVADEVYSEHYLPVEDKSKWEEWELESAELWKEETVDFNKKREWTIDLRIDLKKKKCFAGYYITSSESNFENGVLLISLFAPSYDNAGSWGAKYKPDKDTIGLFMNKYIMMDWIFEESEEKILEKARDKYLD